jgi:hypothetical protein
MKEVIKQREEQENLFVIKRSQKRRSKKRKTAHVTQSIFEKKHRGSENLGDCTPSKIRKGGKRNSFGLDTSFKLMVDDGSKRKSFKNLF